MELPTFEILVRSKGLYTLRTQRNYVCGKIHPNVCDFFKESRKKCLVTALLYCANMTRSHMEREPEFMKRQENRFLRPVPGLRKLHFPPNQHS